MTTQTPIQVGDLKAWSFSGNFDDVTIAAPSREDALRYFRDQLEQDSGEHPDHEITIDVVLDDIDVPLAACGFNGTAKVSELMAKLKGETGLIIGPDYYWS